MAKASSFKTSSKWFFSLGFNIKLTLLFIVGWDKDPSLMKATFNIMSQTSCQKPSSFTSLTELQIKGIDCSESTNLRQAACKIFTIIF